MNTMYAILAVIVMAFVTFLLRVLPFLVFSGRRRTPEWISYLGRVLPCAIMGMLCVYCLKGVEFSTFGGWIPALVSVAATVCLHLIRRNTLLSILGGTICYMVMVQVVFA